MKCKQFSYGQYGTWAAAGEDPHKHTADARDDLAKFLKVEVQSSGKPQV